MFWLEAKIRIKEVCENKKNRTKRGGVFKRHTRVRRNPVGQWEPVDY